jgi:hypothetical protein
MAGKDASEWFFSIDNSPKEREEFNRWLTEIVGLTIEVENKEEAKFYDPGPITWKIRAFPLNLNEIDSDTIKIKIKSKIGFWQIDYAGIDYSRDTSFVLREIEPYEALTNSGENITSKLIAKDDKYYININGEEAKILFKARKLTNNYKHSFFIRSSGFYYEWVRGEWIRAKEKMRTDEIIAKLQDPDKGVESILKEDILPRWRKEKDKFKRDFWKGRDPIQP